MSQASMDPIARLGEYWLRAEIMHDFLHAMREAYDGDLGKLRTDGHWWEFEAFLSYWLSGLFVVVEGFNKLKLKDSRVQKLFKEQLGYLKQLRPCDLSLLGQQGAPAGRVIKLGRGIARGHRQTGS